MVSKVCHPGEFLVLRLARGEEIVQCVHNAAHAHGIRAGMVSGIGAVSDAVVGFFDPKTRAYREIAFSEPMEIVSLSGNFSQKGPEPYAHLHVALGSEQGQVYGGHLVSATVGVTAEIFVQVLHTTFTRELSEEIGVNLLGI